MSENNNNGCPDCKYDRGNGNYHYCDCNKNPVLECPLFRHIISKEVYRAYFGSEETKGEKNNVVQ